MECVLCRLQYAEKSETPFNLCLNNHTSDVFDRNAIPTCRHFAQDKHRFNQHAKSKFIESITNNNKPKQTVQELLKRQKNFCIRTLETLQPH